MEITLESPLDMHLHLREGDLLRAVAPLTAAGFAGGVPMPNLRQPVDSLERLLAYKQQIRAAVGGEPFEPYVPLFFREYSRQELEVAREHTIAVKLYPAGITTNSEAGVRSLEAAWPTLKLMEELGLMLMVHGETEGTMLEREREFMALYVRIAEAFPKLKIVMEHISTVEGVQALERCENLYATVTAHHLLLTLDDLLGGMLNPHLFCKPTVKHAADRDALVELVTKGHPKVAFGSDSAPHPRAKKEGPVCAAGCFTAPIALQLVTELFEKHGALDKLSAFVCDNARSIYGITPPKKTVTLRKQPFTIPAVYPGEIVPMWAGKTIGWTLA